MRKLIYTCDRCNKQFIPSDECEIRIESEFCGMFDLCKSCRKELMDWLRSPKTIEGEEKNIDGMQESDLQ